VVGQSDVDCLDEVLRRRLKHTEWSLPDIFLIDGGKPQVNKVAKVLKEFNVDRPIVGIAKGRERKRNDFIVSQEIKEIEEIKGLLIQVRDEAHRFAISYQRQLRRLK
jgi:excinuclease ABC subunit C